MPNQIRSILAVAAATFTIPVPGNAEGVAYRVMAPVTISSVAVDERALPAMNLDSAQTYFVNGVTLKFVNNGTVTATAVTFVFKEGGYSHSIVDRGTFSPGVLIKHELSVSGLSAFANPEADVAEIDFADGSSWHESSELAKR